MNAARLEVLGYRDGLHSRRIVGWAMSGRGTWLNNAVVERFFGSLKNESLAHVDHRSRNNIQMDVEKHIKYYNYERLHTILNDMSPIAFESVQKKCAA
jgi:putative transposase